MSENDHTPGADALTEPYRMRNILIVGVGGSGIKTIRELRKVLSTAARSSMRGVHGTGARYHFFAIDTDYEELQASGLPRERTHRLDIAEAADWYGETVRAPESRAYKELAKWLPELFTVRNGTRRSGGPVTLNEGPGAGQRRLVSRMVVYHALEFDGLRAALQGCITEVNSVTHAGGQVEPFDVHLVFGLAGGTGSGGGAYIGMELKSLCQTLEIGEFVGHAFLDSALASAVFGLNAKRVEANTYAALMELEHFQKLSKGDDTIAYLATGPKGWGSTETQPASLATHASPSLGMLYQRPFDYVVIYELNQRLGHVSAYRSAAEALFTATYHAIRGPAAGDRNNWQLQLGEVYPTNRPDNVPGLTASYAALGACMVYLPRQQLATYVVQRLLADALERSSAVGLDFRVLAAQDPRARARLDRLEADRRRLLRSARRFSPTVVRRKLGRLFLSGLLEVAASELRIQVHDGGVDSGEALEMTRWCQVARTLTRGGAAPTLMDALLRRVQRHLNTVAARIAKVFKHGLYSQHKDVTSLVQQREDQIADIQRYAGQQREILESDLRSSDFWIRLVEADQGLTQGFGQDAVDLPSVAEMALLNLIVACDSKSVGELEQVKVEQRDDSPLQDSTYIMDLVAEWSRADDERTLQDKLDALDPDRVMNIFSTRFIEQVSEHVDSLVEALGQRTAAAGQVVSDASEQITQVAKPKRGLSWLITALTAEDKDQQIQNICDEANKTVHEKTGSAARRFILWSAFRDALEAVREAAERRLGAYGVYGEVAIQKAGAYRDTASLAIDVEGVGFVHDHELLTDYDGSERRWSWFYLDQIIGPSLEDLEGDTEGLGANRFSRLGRHISQLMISVRSRVESMHRKDLAVEMVDEICAIAEEDIEDDVLAYLRQILTFERALCLQVDYGELAAMRAEALADDRAPELVLKAFYELVKLGRRGRADLDDERTRALLGRIFKRCDEVAAPLANTAPVAGVESLPAFGRYRSAVMGPLPREVPDTLRAQRPGFLALLREVSGDNLNHTSAQAEMLSPDRLLIFRRQIALLPEWFRGVVGDADSMLNELAHGDASADLFTNRHFVEAELSDDGRSIHRRPLLPLLSVRGQEATLAGDALELVSERKSCLIVLLLWSRLIRFDDDDDMGTLDLRFRSGHWRLVVDWDDGHSETLQEEEPRLAETGDDLLAIVKEVRESTADLAGDDDLGLSPAARRDLGRFIAAIQHIDRCLRSLMPDIGERAALPEGLPLLRGPELNPMRAALLTELSAREKTKHDRVEGGGRTIAYPGHYKTDVDRMCQVLPPILEDT